MERHFGIGEKSAESPVLLLTFYKQASRILDTKLEESARDRVGRAIATNIRNFWRKIDGISNSKNRKRVRASKWVTVSFMPNEIMLSPSDVVSQLKEENGHLRETVEEKSSGTVLVHEDIAGT